jgi:ATP-dependent helicase/nuclease subunit A
VSLPPAVYRPDLGPLVRSSNQEDENERDSGHALFRVQHEAEENDEAVRLFYVACTRAADYLILSSARFEGDPASPAVKLLAERFDLDSGESLAELPEGFAAPQIRVTTTEPPLDSRTQQRRERVDPARAAELVAQSPSAAAPRSVAPIAVDKGALRQFSFSQLSGLLEASAPAVESEEPVDASRSRGAGGRRLGTLAHALLAEYPWPSETWLTARLARQAEMLGLYDHEEQVAALELLRRFEQLPAAADLRSARQRHAELDFLLAWPPGAPSGVNLWGVIDALYQDAEGRWHLLDYKTNAVPAGGPHALVDRYRLQMLLYALAVEALLGEPPASVRLVLLEAGLEVAVACDDAALQQARREIDAALARLRST